MTEPQVQPQPAPQFVSAEQVQAVVNAAVAAALGAMQERTDNALAQIRQDHDSEIAALNAALQAARSATPIALVPEHGGGLGTEIHETWSYAEQLAARAEAEAAALAGRRAADARAEAKRVAAASAEVAA